ncbi:copper amine oxidase N-terminal domain-containing protein [Peptoniphilus sp. GNH]|nr:copper amine oxidase N-terminal domain-containing protein [Peptoniphilus sp. GNH]
MKLRRFLFIFVLFALLLTGKAFAARDIKIVVRGNEVKSDVMPLIKNGRTLVPIRVISESLGYDVFWDNAHREVQISKDAKRLTLKIDSKVISLSDGKNNDEISLDTPAKIIKSRTFVPLRAVAELFGEKVNWDDDNSTVFVGDTPAALSLEKKKQIENAGKKANLDHKIIVKDKNPESYIKVLQDNVSDRGDISFDKKNATFNLIPKDLAANFYRHLRDNDTVDDDFKNAFNDEISVIKDYSLQIRDDKGTNYGLRITDPDNVNKTLVFIRDGKIIENNLKSTR